MSVLVTFWAEQSQFALWRVKPWSLHAVLKPLSRTLRAAARQALNTKQTTYLDLGLLALKDHWQAQEGEWNSAI